MVLPTAAITARILVTTALMITRPRLILQHKKQTNTIKEKIANGRKKHLQDFSNQIQRVFLSVKEGNYIKSLTSSNYL